MIQFWLRPNQKEIKEDTVVDIPRQLGFLWWCSGEFDRKSNVEIWFHGSWEWCWGYDSVHRGGKTLNDRKWVDRQVWKEGGHFERIQVFSEEKSTSRQFLIDLLRGLFDFKWKEISIIFVALTFLHTRVHVPVIDLWVFEGYLLWVLNRKTSCCLLKSPIMCRHIFKSEVLQVVRHGLSKPMWFFKSWSESFNPSMVGQVVTMPVQNNTPQKLLRLRQFSPNQNPPDNSGETCCGNRKFSSRKRWDLCSFRVYTDQNWSLECFILFSFVVSLVTVRLWWWNRLLFEKREAIRVNISIETDEDDLVGGNTWSMCVVYRENLFSLPWSVVSSHSGWDW